MSGAQGIPWYQVGAGGLNQQPPGQVGAGNYSSLQSQMAPMPTMGMAGGNGMAPNLAMFAQAAQSPINSQPQVGSNYWAAIMQAMQAAQAQRQQQAINVPSAIGWSPSQGLAAQGAQLQSAPVSGLGQLIAQQNVAAAQKAAAPPAAPQQQSGYSHNDAGAEVLQVPQIATPTQAQMASGWPMPVTQIAMNSGDGRG